MFRKFFFLISLVTLLFSFINNSYSVEPDVFVQSTVNRASKTLTADLSKEERIVCRAGTIVIANLNIWHAGAKNLNGNLRRVIMLNIKNRKYDQLLNYKKYLSNEFKEKLSPEEKYLLAVRKVDKDQILESGGSANKLRREYFEKKKKKFSSVAKN